ncbi:hypothetical protein DPMN_095685 [Dreissena polymorpha]|uniref:Uncharacterized protein n=1 Tax=Dreissena polymorpha TaxID=45954 RepID=A0A9D4L7C5_DREPO|nr:hypothetical protein DPMN_095685 [Dreissena polymorpha]
MSRTTSRIIGNANGTASSTSSVNVLPRSFRWQCLHPPHGKSPDRISQDSAANRSS